MTYWLAQTYFKIFDRKFTVKGECGNGTLQASGYIIILRGYVRQNSGPFGGRENRHGYRSQKNCPSKWPAAGILGPDLVSF